ncbi:MAG TPA: cupin domain-containing protein [Desulfatirhabdiaceae bacterium]|nr:cupin domain-containing protein [Desulfatirhabdiaceae bacterium]
MNRYRMMIFMIGLCLVAWSTGFADDTKLEPKMMTSDEIVWPDQVSSDVQTLVHAGNPEKEGLYSIRVKIPAGTRLAPHFHPDNRVVVVLSGTLYYGYGTDFDETNMKALPPGSFFTEPAAQPHFAWARSGDVVLQANAVGPSGTTWLHR